MRNRNARSTSWACWTGVTRWKITRSNRSCQTRNNLAGYALRGDRREQNPVPVVAVGEPDVCALEAPDVRTRALGSRPETDPALRRRYALKSREELRRAAVNLFADCRIHGAVKSYLFFGRTGDRKTVRALQDIGVAVADHGSQRARVELEPDQVTFDRYRRRQRH